MASQPKYTHSKRLGEKLLKVLSRNGKWMKRGDLNHKGAGMTAEQMTRGLDWLISHKKVTAKSTGSIWRGEPVMCYAITSRIPKYQKQWDAAEKKGFVMPGEVLVVNEKVGDSIAKLAVHHELKETGKKLRQQAKEVISMVDVIPDKYETNDFYVASFLLAKGHKLIDNRKEGDRVYFIFGRTEAMVKDVSTYWTEGTVKVSDFVDAIRRIKRIVFDGRRNGVRR